ncbi:MAG: amidohydrolase family protein, partial [Novosphingobium sp.]
KSPADPYFDPVWQILNDNKVAVTFHVSEANFMHPLIREFGEKPLQSRRTGQTAWQWMFCYSELPVQITLANIIYHNFFERFPDIHIASVENGANWVPSFLEKMDKMRGMAKNGYWPCGQLPERPSKIFKRNCFVVAYPEDDVKYIVDRIGSSECILMGSDYPHAEGVPEPRDFYAEALTDLPDDDVNAIMYENGKRFMRA